MALWEARHTITKRPKVFKSGEPAFAIDAKFINRRDEIALTLGLMVDRTLFGRIYAELQPDYFYQMPSRSGVFICPFAKTDEIFPGVFNPGDIDLLIIPYECNELILDRVLAIEVKAIRASFLKQGKSPNEFGFSQASSLKAIGFPYVAVAHLIFSDESPHDAWRDIGVVRVIDNFGRCEILPDRKIDWLPIDLMKRAFGRLQANAKDKQLGIVSAYIGSRTEHIFDPDTRVGDWFPICRRAERYDSNHIEAFRNLANFFEQNPKRFLDTPRFD